MVVIVRRSGNFVIRYDRPGYSESISFTRKNTNDAVKLIRSLLIKMKGDEGGK